MQKHVNLVDLVKNFPTNIFLQNLASIQQGTNPLKFAHVAENQRNVRHRTFQLSFARDVFAPVGVIHVHVLHGRGPEIGYTNTVTENDVVARHLLSASSRCPETKKLEPCGKIAQRVDKKI